MESPTSSTVFADHEEFKGPKTLRQLVREIEAVIEKGCEVRYLLTGPLEILTIYDRGQDENNANLMDSPLEDVVSQREAEEEARLHDKNVAAALSGDSTVMARPALRDGQLIYFCVKCVDDGENASYIISYKSPAPAQ